MRLTLFGAHESEGWVSMTQHAQQLEHWLRLLAPSDWTINTPQPPPPLPGVYGRLVSRTLRYPLWARGEQGDLNHLTDHSYGALLALLDPARTLVTVHDVAPLRFPGRAGGASGLAWQAAWQQVRRAHTIIAVSAFTAAELAHFGVDQARVRVIHEGVADHWRPLTVNREALARRLGLPSARFVLHVGSTQPRKNLPTLLHAFALLRRDHPDLALLQIGGQQTVELAALAEELGISGAVRFYGKADLPLLMACYSGCELFAFPSRYEGFGLPVLEAMACGAPVVAADTSSLPEVVGDAGLLANPEAPEALAAAMQQVLANPALRTDLRRRGFARAGLLTRERSARATLACYFDLIGANP